MTNEKDRRISERFMLGRTGRENSSPITTLCDSINKGVEMERCRYACFEAGGLFGSKDNKEIISQIEDKYG